MSMKEHSHPIEHLIDFAWANGADRFIVNNAKDELKKLRQEVEQINQKTKEWVGEVYRANEFAVQQTNEYLEIAKKLQSLNDSLATPVAWARINKHGDLYDIRLQKNPYIPELIPLYLKPENA